MARIIVKTALAIIDLAQTMQEKPVPAANGGQWPLPAQFLQKLSAPQCNGNLGTEQVRRGLAVSLAKMPQVWLINLVTISCS